MFSNIKEFFRGNESLAVDNSGSPTKRDHQIAVVALLSAMAYADNAMAPEELQSIFRSLASTFGVEGEEAGELYEIAEFIRKDRQGRVDEFIEAVRTSFGPSQCEHLMGLVWRVLSADGSASKAETSFAASLRKRLGLTLEQAVRARQLAEIYDSPQAVEPEPEQ